MTAAIHGTVRGMRVKWIADARYCAGSARGPGDEFDLEPDQADDLVRQGKVVLVPPEPPVRRPERTTLLRHDDERED